MGSASKPRTRREPGVVSGTGVWGHAASRMKRQAVTPGTSAGVLLGPQAQGRQCPRPRRWVPGCGP